MFGLAWVVVILAMMLQGCSLFRPEGHGQIYSRQASLPLYDLKQWTFDGRMAVAAATDSMSGNIAWRHTLAEDSIKLSGPLGQGATLLRLAGSKVSLDRGDGNVQVSDQPEAFIKQQLGLFVPIRSLRYWALGLPEPKQAFVEIGSGFEQAGWLVEYPQMQVVENQTVPRKITVTKPESKLKIKLIIDLWDLGANAK